MLPQFVSNQAVLSCLIISSTNKDQRVIKLKKFRSIEGKNENISINNVNSIFKIEMNLNPSKSASKLLIELEIILLDVIITIARLKFWMFSGMFIYAMRLRIPNQSGNEGLERMEMFISQ